MRGYLRYVGFSDRVHYWEENGIHKIGWVGLWDWDLPNLPSRLERIQEALGRTILLYRSGRGYHFIALDLTGWEGKLLWFDAWTRASKQDGLEPDYILQRDNVLRINSKNGIRPRFLGLMLGRTLARASSYHLGRVLYKQDAETRSRIRAAHPLPPIKTYGRLKIYTSDPSGIFDIFQDELSLARDGPMIDKPAPWAPRLPGHRTEDRPVEPVQDEPLADDSESIAI